MRDRKWSRYSWGGGPRKKLADSSGLTLVEMLCATLILTLLCVMLSTGLAAASYDYRMLTAEAETGLLLDTITSSLADRLRNSTLSVKDEAGSKTYSRSLGEIKTATGSPDAGKTDPAQGTIVEDGSKALLPDGAYGAVFSEDATNGKRRRYEVTSVNVEMSPTTPDPDTFVTYTIKLEVKDRVTGVSKTTPEGGIVVRCINPVKEIN